MKHYKYLIIGGGLAGDGATQGIRELDAEGSIGMISMEPDLRTCGRIFQKACGRDAQWKRSGARQRNGRNFISAAK